MLNPVFPLIPGFSLGLSGPKLRIKIVLIATRELDLVLMVNLPQLPATKQQKPPRRQSFIIATAAVCFIIPTAVVLVSVVEVSLPLSPILHR